LLKVISENVLNNVYKLYNDIEKNISSPKSLLFDIAYDLRKYYLEYIKWYDKYKDKIKEDNNGLVYSDYNKRYNELNNAITNNNYAQLLEAIDNAINQWHIDFPVIKHLEFILGKNSEEGEDFSDISFKVSEILNRLGRLQKLSNYTRSN
jgi:hypothetical protein